MASTWFYNGQLFTTPTTQSAVDDSAEAPSNATVGNTLAIVGMCDGGQPNVELDFTDPSQVASVLVSGPLCDAVTKAFNPSNDTNAPGIVKAIRVGQPTRAALQTVDASAAPSIQFLAAQYGLPGNMVRIQIETGTNPNTLQLSAGSGQSYAVQDNIGGGLFTVAYDGAAVSAFVGILAGSVTVYAPIGDQLGALAFTSTTTVQDIVNYVNGFTGFTAVIEGGFAQTKVLNYLDPGDGTTGNCKAAPSTYTANTAALLAAANGNGQPYLTATANVGVVNPPAPMAWTYLSGGVYPDVLTSDWANALNVLQGVDCQWVVPLSGDPAIAAAVDAHVQYMSGPGRKERRAFTGPNIGTTLAQVEQLPFAINSDRTSVCWPGYYDYNSAGVLTLYASYMTAVLVAAGFAGQSPGEPMTNKSLTIRGLEVTVRNPTDTDVLIQAGVLCIDKETTGYMVVRSISSWLQNNNYNRVEVSCGAAVDYTQRTVRNAVDPLRGGEAAPQAISRAIQQAETALRLLATPAPNGPGVLVGDTNSPAYQNLSASITGDAMIVEYQCSPVVPLNFIGCTAHIVPYSGTSSATAANSTSSST